MLAFWSSLQPELEAVWATSGHVQLAPAAWFAGASIL